MLHAAPGHDAKAHATKRTDNRWLHQAAIIVRNAAPHLSMSFQLFLSCLSFLHAFLSSIISRRFLHADKVWGAFATAAPQFMFHGISATPLPSAPTSD